ncbi:hypothetical protein JTB14_016881 [Gonioctena quinquepunctata]|nr:hypothetical protein JTB14_016881 [Gonioctena quinquepunctata]
MASKLFNLARIAQIAEKRTIPLQPRRFLRESIKNKQILFQRDDGTPVHLKGGFADKFLLQLTTVLIAIGFVDGILSLLTMAYPKKQG